MEKKLIKTATIGLKIYEDYSYDIQVIDAKTVDENGLWFDEIGSLLSPNVIEGYNSDGNIEFEPIEQTLSAKNTQILAILSALFERSKTSSRQWNDKELRDNILEVLNELSDLMDINRSSLADKITRKLKLTMDNFATLCAEFLVNPKNFKNTRLFIQIIKTSSDKDKQILESEYSKIFL